MNPTLRTTTNAHAQYQPDPSPSRFVGVATSTGCIASESINFVSVQYTKYVGSVSIFQSTTLDPYLPSSKVSGDEVDILLSKNDRIMVPLLSIIDDDCGCSPGGFSLGTGTGTGFRRLTKCMKTRRSCARSRCTHSHLEITCTSDSSLLETFE